MSLILPGSNRTFSSSHPAASNKQLCQLFHLPLTMGTEFGPVWDFSPFRHDVSDADRLPSHCEKQLSLDQLSYYLPTDYAHHLPALCGTLIAKCDDASKIAFVGRSPEGLYEYLRACYKHSDYEHRFVMFMFSCRLNGLRDGIDWAIYAPESRFKLRPYMHALGLAPEDIIKRKQPTALVDFVFAGTTMNCLFLLLAEWCLEEKRDLRGMLGKLRVVSIEREEGREISWQLFGADPLHENEWIRQLGTRRVKRIWIHEELWRFASEQCLKSCFSYTSDKWGQERRVQWNDDTTSGLEICIAHYHFGESREGRAALRAAIAKQPEMRWTWLRTWLTPLRDGAAGSSLTGHDAYDQSRSSSKPRSKKKPKSKHREFREFDEKWLQSITTRLNRKAAMSEQRASRHELQKDIDDQLRSLTDDL